MKQYEHHPISDLFPLVSAAEIKDLAADIKENGLQFPITTYEGKILDGRHRYEACGIAGTRPRFVQYEGDDPVGFVLSVNLRRRHLTDGQRAMIAAKMANMRQGERTDTKTEPSANLRKVSQSEAAEALDVSQRSVTTAVKILDSSPKLTKQIEAGTISLNAAHQQLKEKQAKAEPVLDETGWPIPEELHALWARRGEVRDMMATVTNIQNRLLAFQKSEDLLYSTISFSSAVERLQFAHMEIRAAQLYAVCPSCGGRNFKKCAHCKGRGFLNSYAWNRVPAEVRAIREKGSKQ